MWYAAILLHPYKTSIWRRDPRQVSLLKTYYPIDLHMRCEYHQQHTFTLNKHKERKVMAPVSKILGHHITYTLKWQANQFAHYMSHHYILWPSGKVNNFLPNNMHIIESIQICFMYKLYLHEFRRFEHDERLLRAVLSLQLLFISVSQSYNIFPNSLFQPTFRITPFCTWSRFIKETCTSAI